MYGQRAAAAKAEALAAAAANNPKIEVKSLFGKRKREVDQKVITSVN
jgi:hypothetical protein